jgi:hypothetical protein
MRSRNHRLRKGLAIAVAASALAAPAASARPIDLVPSAATDARIGRGDIVVPQYNAGVNAPSPSTAPTPVTVSDDGFDWADAGIGATGMLALVTIGAGALLASGRRLSRHRVA